MQSIIVYPLPAHSPEKFIGLTIFLLDSNNYLASTKIIIEKTNTVDIAKELINALIIDSSMQDKIPSGFKSIIPSGTTILNLTYDNNVPGGFPP